MIAPNHTATEKPYTELSVTVPSEVTKSLETSRKPVVVNIKGENGNPALADEPNNSAPMVETIVVKLPANIKAEDENKTQVKITGPGKTHIKASVHHGTTFLEIPEGKERRTTVGRSLWKYPSGFKLVPKHCNHLSVSDQNTDFTA